MHWSALKARHLKAVLYVILIYSLLALFYGRFIHNFFAFDDYKYIENLFAGTQALLLGYNNTPRFLSNLVFVPLFAVSGYDPTGYNLFNIVLHGINAVLVAILMQKISRVPMVGTLAGIIFAASAVAADAIFWKCANNSLMSTFFSLLSFLAYLSGEERGSLRARIISLVLFTAAMFSKEDAAALPLIIFLYEVCTRKTCLTAVRRALPHAIIVIAYLVVAQLIQKLMAINLAHYQNAISIRPLYSLFGGYSVFLMNPVLQFPNLSMFVLLVTSTIFFAFFVVKDRRLLFFALAGICLAFLPSSFSPLGSFTAKMLPQSPSRYIYFPSVMASLAMALTLHAMTMSLPKQWGKVLPAGILALFIVYNYQNVIVRGLRWEKENERSGVFLKALRQQISSFPPNTGVYIDKAPMGRSFAQQALRAFYRDPSIYWVTDPLKYVRVPGKSAFVIICQWHTPERVTFYIRNL